MKNKNIYAVLVPGMSMRCNDGRDNTFFWGGEICVGQVWINRNTLKI